MTPAERQKRRATVADASRAIKTFYKFLMHMPEDLCLMVLTRTEPTSLRAVRAAPNSPFYMFYPEHEEHIHKETIRQQFALENTIFSQRFPQYYCCCCIRGIVAKDWTIFRKLRIGDKPDLFRQQMQLITNNSTYREYLCRVRRLSALGTEAIQRGMPLMRQTKVIYYQMLFLWRIFGGLRSVTCGLAQHHWNYFSTLPRPVQLGIDNFFDNLVQAFLHAHPFAPSEPLPTECNEELLPRHLEELRALRADEPLTRSLLMTSMRCLIRRLNNDFADHKPEEQRQLLESFSGTDYWSNFTVNRREDRTVRLSFTLEMYTLRLTGRRGHGNIELSQRNPHMDLPRQLDTALDMEHGAAMDYATFVSRYSEGGANFGPSHMINRVDYWHWRWWRGALGLERLFAGEVVHTKHRG